MLCSCWGYKLLLLTSLLLCHISKCDRNQLLKSGWSILTLCGDIVLIQRNQMSVIILLNTFKKTTFSRRTYIKLAQNWTRLAWQSYLLINHCRFQGDYMHHLIRGNLSTNSLTWTAVSFRDCQRFADNCSVVYKCRQTADTSICGWTRVQGLNLLPAVCILVKL